VDRGGYDATNLDWFVKIPDDRHQVKLYKSDNHMRNFIDCVKSRQPTITPIETAHHSAIPGHLDSSRCWSVGNQVGRQEEVIVGDAEASKLLIAPIAAPWKLA